MNLLLLSQILGSRSVPSLSYFSYRLLRQHRVHCIPLSTPPFPTTTRCCIRWWRKGENCGEDLKLAPILRWGEKSSSTQIRIQLRDYFFLLLFLYFARLEAHFFFFCIDSSFFPFWFGFIFLQ